MADVPPLVTPSLVAAACGTSRRAARRMLHRAGILEKLGGHWVVGESRLRERLPDVYERVFAWVVLGTEKDRKVPERTENGRGKVAS